MANHARCVALLALSVGVLAGCAEGPAQDLARETTGNVTRVGDALAGSVRAARTTATRRMAATDYLTTVTLDGRARLDGDLAAREAAGDDTFKRYQLMRRHAATVIEAHVKAAADAKKKRQAIADGQAAIEERIAGMAPVTDGLHALGEPEPLGNRLKAMFAFFDEVAKQVAAAQAAKPAVATGGTDDDQ